MKIQVVSIDKNKILNIMKSKIGLIHIISKKQMSKYVKIIGHNKSNLSYPPK